MRRHPLLPALAILFVLLAAPASATAAETVHLVLTGASQGLILGDSTQTSLGRADTIECVEYHHLIHRNVDGSGAVSLPVHEAVVVTKRPDQSTPKLLRALNNGERLTAVFKFYRPNPSGDGTTQQFMTVTLENAYLVVLEPFTPSTIDPATANYPPLERARLIYTTYTVAWNPTGVTTGVENPVRPRL